MADQNTVCTRRTYLKSIAAGSVLLAGCSGDSDDDGGSTSDEYEIGIVHSTLNLGGATLAQARGAQWYADAKENLSVNLFDGQLDPTKQNQDFQSLIQQDVDAIGVVPLDPGGISGRIEDAEENDIPVFTADTFASTDIVTHGSSKNNRGNGRRLGNRFVDVLEERRGAAEANLALISAPTEVSVNRERNAGIREVIDEHDGMEEVDTIVVSPASADQATQAVNNYLQTDPDIDTMVTNWIGGMYGILNALERFDMKYPASDENHIPVAGIDCDGTVLDAIGDGFVDVAISPGEQFQYPIALAYMTRYLDAGMDPSVLPEAGSTVESGEFDFPDDVDGVDVFGEPIWAPADVVETEAGYPYVQVGAEVVTDENNDAPYLYGNFLQQLS